LTWIEPEFQPSTWKAFRGLVLEGRTAGDVAVEMGLSVNAVLIAKSRVLQRLRQQMGGLVD
jgi:RNA polymerase sigma-70 factor (ECF subfamily)